MLDAREIRRLQDGAYQRGESADRSLKTAIEDVDQLGGIAYELAESAKELSDHVDVLENLLRECADALEGMDASWVTALNPDLHDSIEELKLHELDFRSLLRDVRKVV